MNRRLLLLATAPLVLLFAAACGDDDDANNATATATPDAPGETPASQTPDAPTPAPEPGLFVVDTASGEGTTAVPGTRCWAGKCIDYAGPVSNADPYSFGAGVELDWQAEGGTVDSISHDWLSAQALSSEVEDGLRNWENSGDVDLADGDIVTPDAAGDYLLVLFARYTTGDDVLFSLYVTIE